MIVWTRKKQKEVMAGWENHLCTSYKEGFWDSEREKYSIKDRTILRNERSLGNGGGKLWQGESEWGRGERE